MEATLQILFYIILYAISATFLIGLGYLITLIREKKHNKKNTKG